MPKHRPASEASARYVPVYHKINTPCTFEFAYGSVLTSRESAGRQERQLPPAPSEHLGWTWALA
jgi:hypothetical protein